MGRQKGQSQRTKGNVRPSSSGRAASMFAENQGFVGFKALSGDLGYVPVLKSLEEDSDTVIDADFRVTLTKLYKKDVTTKLKALTEFIELCQNKESSIVVSILPYWPRIYNRLSDDNDRRVRETVQNALNAITLSVGKDIAPYLKDIMGCWWISQSDSYSPACSASIKVFKTAFPSVEKQKKALLFCHKEILHIINMNIFTVVKTQASKSDEEDKDQERKISSSLSALSSLLNSLGKSHVSKISVENLETFTSNPRLWKFSKHKLLLIRAAFYSLVSSLCNITPDLIVSHLPVICKSVLCKLDDSSPVTCNSLWDAVDALTTTFDEWHVHLDIRKGFLPQLWSVLKGGFHGNGRVIGPHLLPLLNNFPSSLAVLPVYQELFRCLELGLESETIQRSAMETKAAITAAVECMQFVLRKSVESCESPDWKAVDLVLQQQLLPLLEKSIKQPDLHHYLNLPLHQLFAQTLQILCEKASGNSSKQASFVQIGSIIWNRVIEIGKEVSNERKEPNQKSSFESFVSLLGVIKSLCTPSKGKVKSVNFSQSTNDEEVPTEASEVGKDVKDACCTNKVLLENLEIAIKEVTQYILIADMSVTWKGFLLSTLFSKFASRSLLRNVIESDTLVEDCDYSQVFLTKIVEPMIQQISDQNVAEDKKSMVSLVHSCIKLCHNATDFLQKLFAKLGGDGGMEFCILIGLKLVKDKDMKVLHWLQLWLADESNSFTEFLCNLTNDMFIESSLYAIKCKLIYHALSTSLKDDKVSVECNTEMSSLPILHDKSAIALMQGLSKLLTGKISSHAMVEVNRIVFSALPNYIGNIDFLLETSGIFSYSLTQLLNVPSFDFEIENGLKSTLHVLLDIHLGLQSNTVIQMQHDILNKCANVLLERLLSIAESSKTSIGSIESLVEIFAEKLMEHHLPEEFVMDWISHLLPSEDTFSQMRLPLESNVWHDKKSLILGKQISLLNDWEDIGTRHQGNTYPYYCEIVKKSSLIVAKLFDILCNSFPSIKEHTSFKSLSVEVALSTAFGNVGTGKMRFLSHLDTDTIIRNVVTNSASSGRGWLLSFTQLSLDGILLSRDDFFDVIDPLLMVESDLPEELVQTLIAYIQPCKDKDPLNRLLNWVLLKILNNVAVCTEDVNGACTYTLSLFILAALLENELTEVEPSTYAEVLEKLIEWKSTYGNLFLFDCELSAIPLKHVIFNNAIIRIFKVIIQNNPSCLSSEMWDFVQCSLVSWSETLCMTFEKQPSQSYPIWQLSMLYSVCKLALTLREFLSSPAAVSDPTLPASLTSEWAEFFEPATHVALVPIYVHFSRCGNDVMAECLFPVIFKCLIPVASQTLLNAASRLQTYLIPDSNLTDQVQILLHHFSFGLLPDKSCYMRQVISYSMLTKLLEHVHKQENGSYLELIEPPHKLVEILRKVSDSFEKVCSLLEEKSNSQPKRVSSNNSDEEDEIASVENFGKEVEEDIEEASLLHSHDTICYLLVWKLIIHLIDYIPIETRPQYITSLCKDPLTSIDTNLLPKLVQTLPQNPKILSVEKATMFNVDLNLQKEDLNEYHTFQHLTCSLYKDILMRVPTVARTWFASLSKLVRAETDEYTSKYVSPVICNEELNSISQADTPPSLQVRARRATRDVVAVYEVVDAEFEISIQLPPNHPLTPVQVNTVKRVGIATAQWRYWILQMTMLLQHQNGTILDALLLWKQKVDKRLDGLEECMICFSVVHGSNAHSLPKLQCKTCRKKFHPECLYKWFDTSNQSTCPLCRSPMMFR